MSGDPGAGGYHWQTETNVRRWVDTHRSSSSDRNSGFDAMLSQLPADTNAPLRIIDLGAGDGKVASVVLDHYPKASAVLVDFSDPMIAQGMTALSPFAGRFEYLKWDMNVGDWPEELAGPYDAVLSAAAIHHLDDGRKRWLADAVAQHLMAGGLYANFDLFKNEDAAFTDEQIHGMTCATIASALSFLEQAGFVDVTVTARESRERQQGERALMTGRKP